MNLLQMELEKEKASSALEREIAEDAYRSVEPMVAGLCWKVVRKYGGDFDDWMGEASVLFMEAIQLYDSSRAEFTTWIYNYIYWHLKDVIRCRSRVHPPLIVSLNEIPDLLDLPLIVDDSPSRRLATASEECQTIRDLLESPPARLLPEIDITDPTASWDAVRRYIQIELRWTRLQILKTVIELKKVFRD